MIKGNNRYLLLKFLEEEGITYKEAHEILSELINNEEDKKDE